MKLEVGLERRQNEIKDTEEHYLDNVYPLFKDNQDANRREAEVRA